MKRLLTGVLLAVLALGLPLALNSCFFARTALTIYNQSTDDLETITWTDDYGVMHEFGDDDIWDDNLQWVKGIAIGSSSTREVSAGSNYMYYYYKNDAVLYRTTELIWVSKYSDESFIFDDLTGFVPVP